MTKVVTSDNKITYWQHEAWHTLIGLNKNTDHVTQDIKMDIIEEFGSYEVALDRLQMYRILRT
jgi:superoxide dismutase